MSHALQENGQKATRALPFGTAPSGIFGAMPGEAFAAMANVIRHNFAARASVSDTAMELVDGRMFDPFNPDIEALSIDVISQSLANACRFGGQIRHFYSTAQHSVLVALLAPKDMPAQRAALLHDGDETVGLPDMITPVKAVFTGFKTAQNRIGDLIARRYGFTHADHMRIKPADSEALATEKRTFKNPKNAAYWERWSNGQVPADWLEIVPLDPGPARDLFLAAWARVDGEGKPIDRDWIAGQPGFRLL